MPLEAETIDEDLSDRLVMDSLAAAFALRRTIISESRPSSLYQ